LAEGSVFIRRDDIVRFWKTLNGLKRTAVLLRGQTSEMKQLISLGDRYDFDKPCHSAPLAIRPRPAQQAWQIDPSAAPAAAAGRSLFASRCFVVRVALAQHPPTICDPVHAAATDAQFPRDGSPGQPPLIEQPANLRDQRVR
jgi:hypothetical protein